MDSFTKGLISGSLGTFVALSIYHKIVKNSENSEKLSQEKKEKGVLKVVPVSGIYPQANAQSTLPFTSDSSRHHRDGIIIDDIANSVSANHHLLSCIMKSQQDGKLSPGVTDGFKPSQCHENDIAKFVLVHEPGIEALLGSLHSSGSLFERPVNLGKARRNHQQFKKSMQAHGVTVLDVRDILILGCETNLKYRMELEELALDGLEYHLSLDHHQHNSNILSSKRMKPNDDAGTSTDNHPDLSEEQKYLFSDAYKRECLSAMSVKDLVDIVLIGPTVNLFPSKLNTPLRLENLKMRPMLNLTFQRDQQIVTNKGLVIMNMGSEQRKFETNLMRFCFKKLGIKILGEIEAPGTAEGGDFIPAGDDLCFIGVGLRTNQEAVDQLLKNDWFGTDRVAVVKDVFDCDQQRMHLDTYFNILNRECCVMLETIIGEKSPIKRLVTEYTKTEDGKYTVSRKDVEFSQYVQEEGYSIIPITEEQQANYGINFLNLGDDYIIAVDPSTARSILDSGKFKGDIEVIDFSGMTTMYGSVHCCSQVLFREPLEKNIKKNK